MPIEPAGAPADTPRVARIISSDSVPAGGFTPGTILADRYRIIGLLGRGGMGEVYRADDLKLGQPVALKFLPPKLAEDPVRRERFFAEVRITRQLSHPNICRVYDIGEIEGRHFLSMEFIDGEDLASLLKRIGYLSNEKALDIARQLAAGLAIAHERGVLHRDLKPANIMLDGHGHVRITDFGLAIALGEEAQAAEIAGTPAYMAPEQLSGKGATIRSDMYSLGLVLYEIYTGKKAFTAINLAELRQQKETYTPRAISELRDGMDPVVERLIRRCMERDPLLRPASMAQLALALPGGDPLAAAIAAGETPSPEMVAASGSKEGLRLPVALGLLVIIILGSLATLAINDRFAFLHRRIPFNMSPEMLVERSHEILKKLGFPVTTNSLYGFERNSNLLSYIHKSDKSGDRWKKLDAKAILFSYRQSPYPLKPGDPALQSPGEIQVVLDTEGRLEWLRAVPEEAKAPVGKMQSCDWNAVFSEAGLDITQWTPVDDPWRPLFYADSKEKWQGAIPNWPNVPIKIEAAAYKGRPISFEILGPWARSVKHEPAQGLMSPLSSGTQIIGAIAFLTFAAIGGAFLARRNIRSGRGDRRGANRLALLIFGLLASAQILRFPHNAVSDLFLLLLSVCALWIFYLAIEPFARRRWPQALISWTRLLSGEWRDRLVARDVLIGSTCGALTVCLLFFSRYAIPLWLGQRAQPLYLNFQDFLGARFFISYFLNLSSISLAISSFPLLCAFVFIRSLLRNQAAAIIVCVLVIALLSAPPNPSAFTVTVSIILSIFGVAVLMRFGLVALAFDLFAVAILSTLPITLDASAWYAGYGFAALAIFAVVVLYAFYISLGNRPLFDPSHLDD
ncbi:MAG: protein kinase [Acidobacteria bacterium]|nr:protein kinase [Acidobacteriota bacterium]